MGFLQGRRILVTGMLSNRSIAYGIAKACSREGAELAFTYQGEGVRERVAGLAGEFGTDIVLPCDVADDAQIDALFTALRQRWDALDGLVHALGPGGIRVNAISAGPIKTLAAAGIGGFSKILHFVERNAPLRRGVTTEEVGNTAAFLLSDLASGITGEVLYVDAGFSTTTAGLEPE